MSTSLGADFDDNKLDEIFVAMKEKLEEACKQRQDNFRKPVCPLQPVAQWKANAFLETLEATKMNASEEGIALLPYFVQQGHWIGIIMKFDTYRQLQRAEYFDPVIGSSFDSESTRQQFSKVFDGSPLVETSLKKHQDTEFSEELTIENLLNAAEELTSTHSNKLDAATDQIRSGNDSEHFTPRNDSNFELDRFVKANSFSGSTEILSKIPVGGEEFLDSPSDRTHHRSELNHVDESETMSDDLTSETGAARANSCLSISPEFVENKDERNGRTEEYFALKVKLQTSLNDNDLIDESELKERIESKKQDIERLEKANKHKEAQKGKNSLAEFEEIPILVDQIRIITPSSIADGTHRNIAEVEPPNDSDKVKSDVSQAMNSVMNKKLTYSSGYQDVVTATVAAVNQSVSETSEVRKGSELLNSVEALKDLQNDLNTFPVCAEKHLFNLLFYTSLKMSAASQFTDFKFAIPQDIDTKIMQELQCMQQRLVIEEIHTPSITAALSSYQLYCKSQHWEPTLNELRKIRKSLSPINMQELKRLVDRVDDAAKLIEDKEIILLIGGTGTGKSTTIHFLGGSKMIETQVKGMYHIAPTQIKNADLQKIATAPSATAITRYIAPVTINLKDIGHRKNSTVILCDSPGFEDTSGPEVDIANGIGIVKAIRGCRSVKLVVLVSSKSIGDRCTGIKDLAHTLVGLMPGIKDHMKAFTYLFTKFSTKERNTIHATLIDVEDHLLDEEKSDSSFTSILTDMIRKTRRGAKAIDPVNDDPVDIMDDLMDSASISHPEEVFHFSVSEKSKSSVQEQVRANQIAIIAATKRSDHAYIHFKLDQLRYLHELLQQEYIEKIYKDSIAFVSKHVIEQYHTATTTFHRCVIHQTTLSIDDIKQYQISIQHAKDADELRNKHLSQDVPHSSAYAQYLDQLIQTLSHDLKDRNIDETIVKVHLDKIKLLTTYFVQVQEPYQQAVALFTQKLESVARDAKKSVFDHKFDETANHLKVLQGAIRTLTDHLECEKLETIYKEQKNMLVTYLTDSTTTFNSTFDRKLEKSDIDNLDRCVCMIESAEKTFALHSHVSQDRINEIRETLSNKILNHFNKIVDQIRVQIKEKKDLKLIEQRMSELDAIRKISGFDILTTQSYFSTLEQLIGYINECRRDAEKLLDALFKQESVDFTRLVDSLVALQGARWIEKYREGIHADLIGFVERRILEHIEQLIKIVMQSNLDLERPEKVKDVYQIIVRIDEMKRLNRFFPSIEKQVDQVHAWFITVTNKVFDSLTSAFNTDKLKEQGCLALDFSKAEKGLQYLSVCKDIPPLFESRCASTLSCLEEFIRRFSANSQDEIATHFENIKQYGIASKDDIHVRARAIASRLNELSEIQEKHKLVFSFFISQRIVEEWTSNLSSYHSELQDEMTGMSHTGRVEDLNARLSIAKALGKLDGFMKDHQFMDLYKQYQEKFFSNTDEACRKAIEAINKNDYDIVASEMAALQRADKVGEHFSKRARRAINFGVSTLMDEVKNKAIMLGHDVERDQINNIVTDLKKLQKVKQFISEYIDTPEDIDTCIKEVKEMIADKMKRFLQGVRAAITVNNFSDADRKLDSITLTRNLLGVYCTEDVAKEISNLRESQSDLVFIKLVSKYNEMDISSYPLDPPKDIFAKLAEVKHTNPIYNEASNAIRDAILAKFRQELANPNSLQPPSIDNAHIRKFESAVKYLPKEMKESLEEELKYCKENATKLLDDYTKKLRNTLISGDLKAIKAIFEEYQKSEGMNIYSSQVRDHIVTTTKDIIKKIQERFDKRDISTALENVRVMHDYRVEFDTLVPDIKRQCFDIRHQVNKVFEDAYLCFLSRFVEEDISTVQKEAVATIETKFEDLFCFIEFSNKYRDLSTLDEILPADFRRKTASLHEKLARSFSRCEKKYRDALESLDIVSLKMSLEDAELWSSLIVKIVNSYTKQHIYDDSTEGLIAAINKLTRFEKMTKAVDARLEKLRDELVRQELINDETKEFGKRRDDFYAKLNEKFVILIKAKELTRYNEKFDAAKAETECLASLENKIKSISDAADKIFQQFIIDRALTKIDYDHFNLLYNNLLSCRKEMKMIKSDSTSQIGEFAKQVETKINTWLNRVSQQTDMKNHMKVLIEMKTAANQLPQFSLRIEQEIDTILAQIKSDQTNKTAFGKLGVLLNQDRTGVGQSIVAEHKAFQGYSLSLFNEKTQRHGIDYVLEKLKGDRVDKDKLRRRYDEFLKIYEQLIQQYLLKSEMNLEPLIATTKTIAGDIKQQKNEIEWDASIRSQVPKLAAHIFALWTLQSAHHYFETTETDKRDSYLLKPHAAQVISIFRMLGIGDTKEELSNNLVQIGTGEGKSVTLGATATLLALLGFDVSCACYSEYLSGRDYSSFLPLFTSLGVEKYIHYGTFDKLCENIINEDGDIRQVVEQLISTDQNQAVANAKQGKRAKILLIDEVDVFFSRDFYGNIYTPAASLRDPTITALVNHIWTNRKTKITLSRVRMTEEYKKCRARFPKWEALIQEAIKDMIADVVNFESHKYVVKDDKIGYIEQDNVVFNVVYGYKTLFAYFLEHEQGKVSRMSLDEKISMKVKCGGYSYAETPLEFQYIMGVTGTLETLSEPEKEVIKTMYNIKKQTISPSVFGENNLQFTKKDDIRIETSDDYYNVIKREIDDRLKGKSYQRAVLVFFESEKKLRDFHRANAMKLMQGTVAILTEEATSNEKELIIKRATASGQVTLFTKTFGRGTDFICYDPGVASNGGIHVIQTFLSEEVSEEVQIKGRTARQGDCGSYSMILLEEDLEKFQISPADLKDVRDGKAVFARYLYKMTNAAGITHKCESVYDLLNDRRKVFFKTQYEANMQYVEAARVRHREGRKFLTSLTSGDIETVKKFLIEENKGAPETCNSRTICLMDATASMTHLLQKAKNTVGVMFDRAAVVLKDNGISEDCFQLQFVVYRNYCCKEDKILQHSPWETKSDNLRAFMKTIDVEGGWGNEAIEIGLLHANEENERDEITQIILIGDAPPNTKAEVAGKRQRLGEDYWKKTKFARATCYEDELNKLKMKKVPVHAFYVDDQAKESFEGIANETGGRCEFLDINSPSGSDMLTNLVTEEILRSVGGSDKGTKLVDAYKAKFARSYVT